MDAEATSSPPDVEATRDACSGEQSSRRRRGARTKVSNPYTIFYSEIAEQMKKDDPHRPISDLSKSISSLWKELSTEEKQIYKDKAKQETQEPAKRRRTIRYHRNLQMANRFQNIGSFASLFEMAKD